MKITLIEINSLNPAEYNPRQISNKQYEDLKASMEKFGCVDPIIININPERLNVVVGGHQRLRILKQLGAEKVPTVSVNLSQEDERELNVRLNKNGGDWDMDLLSNFDVVDLKEWGFKDIELGFNIDKIDEEKESDIVLTIKEDDISKASNLHKELIERGFNATIKW
jgi:ParB-like chromosome segregation protein Spo0J